MQTALEKVAPFGNPTTKLVEHKLVVKEKKLKLDLLCSVTQGTHGRQGKISEDKILRK